MASRLIYQVNTIDPLVGKRSKLYEWCIESVKKYCEKYNIDHILQTEPILRHGPVDWRYRSEDSRKRGFMPIYEKENAFAYFDRYDQIAIVDSDIYIHDHAPNIFEHISPDADFAGVLERDMPLTDEYKRKVTHYSRAQYQWLHEKGYADFKPNNLGYEFYNMGLMLMNKSIAKYLLGQTPKQFLSRKKFQPFVEGRGAWIWSTDQTLLNFWVRNAKMNLQRLDWRWNAMFKAITDEAQKEAYFTHIFHKQVLPEKGENVELMEKVINGKANIKYKHR